MITVTQRFGLYRVEVVETVVGVTVKVAVYASSEDNVLDRIAASLSSVRVLLMKEMKHAKQRSNRTSLPPGIPHTTTEQEQAAAS